MVSRIFLLVLGMYVIIACNSANTEQVDQNFYKSVGAQIREQRLSKGISQQDLADAVGISQNGLSLIEDGLATPIHTKLIAIQDYLNITFKINGKYTSIEEYIIKKE